jgi:hypothetical protein
MIYNFGHGKIKIYKNRTIKSNINLKKKKIGQDFIHANSLIISAYSIFS